MNVRLYMIMAVLLMVSCEKTMEFPAEQDGRIYVHAMLGKEGENVITLDVSQPVNGAETSTVMDIALTLEADGKPVSVEKNAENSYIVMEKLLPGQKLRLTAQAEGLPSVNALTTVPDLLPKVDVCNALKEMYKTKDAGQVADKLVKLRELSIIIDERPTENSYFGVQVERKLVYDSLGTVPPYAWNYYEKHNGEIEIDQLYVNGQYGEHNGVSLVDIEIMVDFEGGDLRVMPAVEHDGGSIVQVYVEPTKRRLWESVSYSSTNENYEIYKGYEYKVKLYRLSPELFHCLRSRYLIDNSELPVYMGFTPVTYIYTNVEGGLGVFGAVTSYETEWFRIEQ